MKKERSPPDIGSGKGYWRRTATRGRSVLFTTKSPVCAPAFSLKSRLAQISGRQHPAPPECSPRDRVCIGCLLDFSSMDQFHGRTAAAHGHPKSKHAQTKRAVEHDYAALFNAVKAPHRNSEDGILRVKHTGTKATTFRIRPVVFVPTRQKECVLDSLRGEYKATRYQRSNSTTDLERRGKKIIHTVPMDVIRSETVALERRVFVLNPKLASHLVREIFWASKPSLHNCCVRAGRTSTGRGAV